MLDTLAYGNNITGWLIIGAIAILLFGANRIPEMMKGFGSGLKEFKKGYKEDEPDDKDDKTEKK